MKILLLFLGLTASSAAWAAGGDVDFFASLFAPSSAGPRARLEERMYAKEYAADSPFGLAQTRFDASVPVWQSASDHWRASTFADYDAIESAAVFPNGRRMPNRLWDLGASVSDVRNLEDGRTAGGSIAVSSPADRPFAAGRDFGVNLNLNYKIPQPDGNAWILFLNVSNTRGFLNYVPLPGAAYFFQSGKKLRGLLGVPFAMLFWTPSESWTVTTFFFPLRTGELRVAYGSPRGPQPYALVSYRSRNYRLFDRTDPNERIYFDEGLAQAGVTVPFLKGLILDAGAGISFARRYYLATKPTGRGSAPGIAADNAPFANLKVSSFF
ncbi:MAG: hypothetical protein ACXVCK_13835 [Bdellovibrionota bacterium]